MSKYLVETFYTCTFKIIHTIDELNEKKLSELENREDGKYEIIDVKLNNRKTKTIDNLSKNLTPEKTTMNATPGFSSLVNKKIADSDKNEINTGELINIFSDQGLAEIYNNLFTFFAMISTFKAYDINI